MASIRSKNTIPEMLIRKALWMKGFRYRIHYGKEKIDIAFPKKKIAIYVDGCFWHLCPEHSRIPKGNNEYWAKKLTRNATRDKEKDLRLKTSGWDVIHVWEHELKEFDTVITKLEKEITQR